MDPEEFKDKHQLQGFVRAEDLDEMTKDELNSPQCRVKKSLNFVKLLILTMMILAAFVTLMQVIVHILTAIFVLPDHDSTSVCVNSLIHPRVSLVDWIIHGKNHGPQEPWTDPKWVTKVKQSGVPKKAGGYSVLVTGAAGFVGSYASIAMRRKGWGVVGLDNFNGYHHPSIQREREAHVTKNDRIFIVEGDINDEMLLQQLFNIVRFTHVLHLAAQTGLGVPYPDPDHESPLSFVDSNVAGFVTLLEVCAKAKPQPAVVWASSSSVYGLNIRAPFSEFDVTDEPTSLYAATKKAGEELVHVYNHMYGLSITGLRLFDIYGPWSRPDMEVFRITDSIVNEKTIFLYAEEAHDLSYIDDIINGCITAVETADKSLGSRNDGKKHAVRAQLRLFNLGAGLPTRMTDIISILENLLNKKAKEVIRLQEMEALSHMYAVANLSHAATHLGYRPHTDLTDGLKNFVTWYYHHYETLRFM